MRRYRSERIQKTLIALSGAALASTMMFTSAQNITQNDNIKPESATYNYYQTKINSQLHKAVKDNKGLKHESKKQKVKKNQKD